MGTVSRVSIIIPTYDRVAYLRDAVGSVLAQTLTDWELIVADDGSTDGTREYLATLSDPRIRVVHLEHCGRPARVRNRAMDDARAPYIAFLDSDDWWEPEKLAVQLAALEAHPACGWSYTSLRRVDEQGREIPVFTSPPRIPEEGFILEDIARGDAGVFTSTLMVRRTLIAAAGGFDESLVVAEDFEFWIRLAERSPAAGVSRVLATRRRHADSHGARRHDDFDNYNKVFRLVSARTPSARVRAVLRRRRAHWLAHLATERSRGGQTGPALFALSQALPAGLVMRRWWLALFRTLRRTFYRGAGPAAR